MPRIQIELTSARPDGNWTWRVAGARQPRGTLAADLLPPDAKVGDVLRVEADVELEGTVITAVLAAPNKRPEREKLEVVGNPTPFEGVTTSLLPKGSKPRRGGSWDQADTRRDDRPRGAGPRAGGPSRRDRPAGSPGPPGASGDTDHSDRPPRTEGRDDRPQRGEARRDDRPGRGEPRRDDPSGAGERPGAGRETSGRPSTPRRTDRGPSGGTRPDAPHRTGPRQDTRQAPPAPPRPKRLTPASTNRTAVLATLAPEERPVAEQILHGGIPAVRRALQEQNAKARADGQPEVKADAIVALAEELLPRLKAAEWRDRADAAVADLEELSLRDLRSVVAGADSARDDETRLLAKTLRDALERREAKERQGWLDEITTSVDEGRVVRALRLSARPPDPRTRFPSELVSRLSDAAGAALTTDSPADRWITVLEAVIESPVRRSVKPAGIPSDPAVLNAARQAAGRVPALAAMLGIAMPPPPGPLRPGARPTRPLSRGGPRPGGLPPRRPIPPPPASRATRPPQESSPARQTAEPAIAQPVTAAPEAESMTEVVAEVAPVAPVEAAVAPVEADVAPVEAEVAPVEAEVAPVEATEPVVYLSEDALPAADGAPVSAAEVSLPDDAIARPGEAESPPAEDEAKAQPSGIDA